MMSKYHISVALFLIQLNHLDGTEIHYKSALPICRFDIKRYLQHKLEIIIQNLLLYVLLFYSTALSDIVQFSQTC